ncbi:MAG: hypothetical protein FWG85_06865 [Bacteroidetes bacterium]|nr:hypothetical protein [Bacteroidota bacterium]
MTQTFTVSNYNFVPPFLMPPLQRIQELFRWGWYPGGVFSPYSVNQNISVPAPPSGTANILMLFMQDSLAVRYDYPNYDNNGCYTGYTIIFEKIIPLNPTP